MILRGFIVARLGSDAVISIGGTLLPWQDTANALSVGDIVQLELVPGNTFGTRTSQLGRRDTNRLLLLESPFKAVLAIPRTGPIPARVDLQLSEVPAEIAEGFDSATADISDDSVQPASGSNRDVPLRIPPALQGLFTPQSGPTPQ